MPIPRVLQSLVATTIDYAGTFAPASLPIEAMFEKAASFRRTATLPWLMNRATLSLTDLLRIRHRTLWDRGADGSPWIFTALGSPVQSTADWIRTVEWDCREIRRFNEKFGRSSLSQQIVALEIKAPSDLVSDPEATGVWAAVLDRVAALQHGPMEIYLELDFSKEPSVRLADHLAVASSSFLDTGGPVRIGLKFRYAGNPLPTPAAAAEAISLCATHGLQFKATQGLHEAFTHNEHLGFLNLFLALNFAFVHGTGNFTTARMIECLRESDPSAFVFSDVEVTWKGFTLDLESVENARRRHAGCFGSCSLEEPEASLLKIFS